MPELPEVETVRRDLSQFVIGRKIVGVEVRLKKYVSPQPGKFTELLIGSTVRDIERRGKLLVIHLDNAYRIHIHLKMTGQLVLSHGQTLVAGGHPMVSVKDLPNKHTHLVIVFDNKDILYCNDQRQFGYARLHSVAESDEIVSARYGIEPLSDQFTLKFFRAGLARRPKTTIKALLLDQKFVAGLGNIYVDESCFKAGVLPMRRVGTLNDQEMVSLHQAIRKIIALAVKHRGTTFNNYVSIDGRAGQFWKYCAVYGRAGTPCKQCGVELVKTTVAQRGTTYCPNCQK